jgi:hypothetical protein
MLRTRTRVPWASGALSLSRLGVPTVQEPLGSQDRGYVGYARPVTGHRICSFLRMQHASEFDFATAAPRQTESPVVFAMKKGRPESAYVSHRALVCTFRTSSTLAAAF